MNPYIQKLNEWLAQQEQPNYGCTDIHTLLQLLWYSYTEYNPIENDRTDALFSSMRPVFDMLPLRAEDHLVYKICELMNEYGQSAFLTGIQIGVRLCKELAEDTSPIKA